MSNRLKQITTKAKALYKSGKYAKWTDAIKAASKQTASVGAPKKKAAKKVAKKKTSVKKAAPKKKAAAKSFHKDTKSHNVRISVVSGIGSLLTHYKDAYGKLSSKKLLEKTKRGKHKIAKEMTTIAAKIKKLKNW